MWKLEKNRGGSKLFFNFVPILDKFFLYLHNGYHKNNISDTVNDFRSNRVFHAVTRVNQIWLDRKIPLVDPTIRDSNQLSLHQISKPIRSRIRWTNLAKSIDWIWTRCRYIYNFIFSVVSRTYEPEDNNLSNFGIHNCCSTSILEIK